MTSAPTDDATQVDVTPANRVHLTASQFADAVAMVKPHLGKDDTLPMLTAYRLDVRGGDLWLSATDRFSAAAARIEPFDDPLTGTQRFAADFHAVLPRQLVDRAVSIFKPNRRFRDADPRIAISVTEHQTVIEERTQVQGWVPTRLADTPPTAPPDITKLLHDCLDVCRKATEHVPEAGFNARFFARFAGVPKVIDGTSRPSTPLVLRQASATKPLIATCGDRFVGALMPVRLYDTPDLDSWVKRLTPKAAAK